MYPILFTVSDIPFYSYAIFLGVALGVSIELTLSLFSKFSSLPRKKLSFVLFILVLSAWIGAKLFFLIFSLNDNNSPLESSSFWMGGGFVFYGSLIAILVIFFFMVKVFKLLTLKECGLFVPGAAFGHAIGRIGCFLAGCCFGHSEHIFYFDSHPVQLYEALMLIFLGFIFLKRINEQKFTQSVLFQYVFSYSIVRFVLEFFRGDLVRGAYWVFSTSQWISVIILFIVILRLIYLRVIRSNFLNKFL